MPRALNSRISCWMLMCMVLVPGRDLDEFVDGRRRTHEPLGFDGAGDGRAGGAGLDGAVSQNGKHLLSDGGGGERLGPEIARRHQRDRLAFRDVHRGFRQPRHDQGVEVAMDEAGGDDATGIGDQAIGIGPAEDADIGATGAGDERAGAGQHAGVRVGRSEITRHGRRGGLVDLRLERHVQILAIGDAVGKRLRKSSAAAESAARRGVTALLFCTASLISAGSAEGCTPWLSMPAESSAKRYTASAESMAAISPTNGCTSRSALRMACALAVAALTALSVASLIAASMAAFLSSSSFSASLAFLS